MSPMIHLLAQTTQPAEQVDWGKWLTLIGVVSILQLLFQPIIGGMVRSILSRLKAGDNKFEEHAEKLTGIGTRLVRVESDIKEANKKLDESRDKAAELEIEGNGSVSKLRNEIERDFLRKQEFKEFREEANDRHGEMMKAIHGLGGSK